MSLLLQPHLCGAGDRLAGSVAASNHHLLCYEDLLCGDLNTQVTTGNHDAVAGLHDFIKPNVGDKSRSTVIVKYNQLFYCAWIFEKENVKHTCAHPHGFQAY